MNSSRKNLTKTNKNQLKTSMNLATPKNKKLKNAQKIDYQTDVKKKEELKIKRRKEKLEEDKVKEREMWNCLNEFNSKFKKINELKKVSKKMFSTVL